MSISYSSSVPHPEVRVSEAIAKPSTATSDWVRRAAQKALEFTRSLRNARAGVALFAVAFASFHWLYH